MRPLAKREHRNRKSLVFTDIHRRKSATTIETPPAHVCIRDSEKRDGMQLSA